MSIIPWNSIPCLKVMNVKPSLLFPKTYRSSLLFTSLISSLLSTVFSSSPPFWRELFKISVTCWFYTAQMIGEWMSMEHWQRVSGRGNRKCWEKNLSTATLTLTVTHRPAWDRTDEEALRGLRLSVWFLVPSVWILLFECHCEKIGFYRELRNEVPK